MDEIRATEPFVAGVERELLTQRNGAEAPRLSSTDIRTALAARVHFDSSVVRNSLFASVIHALGRFPIGAITL